MTEEQKNALLQAFDASGYERGEAYAAEALGMLRGLLHGVAPLLEAYAAAQNVTETITDDGLDDETAEAGAKTRLEDCKACRCNTCAVIERCVHAPKDWRGGVRPYPCDGCADGMRYMPIGEAPTCSHYVQGEENNE